MRGCVKQSAPWIPPTNTEYRGMADRWDASELPTSSAEDDRPDQLSRLEETTDALVLLRDAVTGEESLDEALTKLAETARNAIADADAVTVSVIDGLRPRTAATTDERLAQVDEKQYSSGRGPCLESARTLTAVRSTVREHSDLWPEFVDAATAHGVRAYLSIPVVLTSADQRDDAEHVGSLNLYSLTPDAFDPFDEGLMRLFSTAACAIIADARKRQHSQEQVHHLEQALVSRAVIEQAKGVLMAVHGCTEQEAFTMLVERSQHENVKLRDVARTLLSSIKS
ncbi:ANTAR domain-containing protein [Lentzea sp. NPDC058450]|uniref:ANTAR domain-containing protein n=1 Tax=Lentzea sp. NPDC058450 TaxID=3346505 RepID=UPI00366051F0